MRGLVSLSPAPSKFSNSAISTTTHEASLTCTSTLGSAVAPSSTPHQNQVTVSHIEPDHDSTYNHLSPPATPNCEVCLWYSACLSQLDASLTNSVLVNVTLKHLHHHPPEIAVHEKLYKWAALIYTQDSLSPEPARKNDEQVKVKREEQNEREVEKAVDRCEWLVVKDLVLDEVTWVKDTRSSRDVQWEFLDDIEGYEVESMFDAPDYLEQKIGLSYYFY
ncbi:hypothetical protein FB567DRAFT_972 [Paraphoma chrysanthemicola]|uniref:Uncharacterized protein n=1 Tax=Paraphoma chrysanthemicola TaxID=798071 RepID=A0A8K0RGX2_9PLEO|nr:hypothetical protein FB567DRAFT_972 [Paraphoma chrysanthemicola]